VRPDLDDHKEYVMARTGRTTRIFGALAATLLLGVGLSAPQADAGTPTGRVVFRGSGLRVTFDHQPQALDRTSPSFRRFLQQELDELWGWDDRKPACRPAPVVMVKEYRASGVAFLSDEGVFGVPHHPECAGGGVWQFAVRRDGRWISPRALAGQDVPGCGRLRKWDIPRMSGATTCYSAKADAVIDYTPAPAA
jgi:hypothetical protein